MHVLRHHDVAHQRESEPPSNLLEDFQKAIARPSRSEMPPSTVTTKRDEMKIAAPVKSLEGLRCFSIDTSEPRQNPHPHTPRVRHPLTIRYLSGLLPE